MVFLLLLLLTTQSSDSSAIDASRLEATAPKTIASIETDKLKGDPARLAWSPDGKQLYVMSVERDKKGNPTGARHFLVTIEHAKVNTIEAEPAWANEYWRWKSAQAGPGSPADKIAVDERKDTVRSTAAPMAGDLARGGSVDPTGGTSVADAGNASLQTQTVTIFTLRWHGVVIGEWTNEAVVPGLTFGWAPGSRNAIAFSNKEGRMTVVDARGSKKSINDVHDATLPSWSNDGRQIAFLQKADRKHYSVNVVDVK